jgi:alanine dehydrogenase
LSNATFPYILQVANDGFKKQVRDSHEIRTALNMTEGHLTIKEVAETFDLPYKKYA